MGSAGKDNKKGAGSKKKNSSLPVIIGALSGAAVTAAVVIVLFFTPGYLKKDRSEEAAKTENVQEEAPAVSENESAWLKETGEELKAETDEPEIEQEEEELDRSEYIYFKPVIEESKILERDKVKITAKGLHADGDSGDLYLDISVENGTDKKITVLSGEGYVNGLLADVALAANVEPGKTKDDRVIFMGYSMKIYDIGKIGELELNFRVIESDTYQDLFVTEPVSIKTDLYGTFEQEYYDFGDENMLNIRSDDEETVKGIKSQFVWYFKKGELIPETAAMVFYVQNNTDKDYTFASTDIQIDGEDATGFVENTLWPGHRGMLLFQITGREEDEEPDAIEARIDIYKGSDISSGENIGYFGLLYNPNMEDDETVERYSTKEVPDIDDFKVFNDILDNLSDKRKINYAHAAYDGGYKAFILMFDDTGKNAVSVRFLTADIKTEGEDITITMKHDSEYFDKTGKTKDISNLGEISFTGKWNADDDFTADSDDGKMDMAIITTDDGQYALGDFTYPDGKKAELGLMRP